MPGICYALGTCFVVHLMARAYWVGLIGLVPLTGLEPGLRRIVVVWNPGGNAEAAPLDDRYTQISNTFVIPIAFSPGFEIPLD